MQKEFEEWVDRCYDVCSKDFWNKTTQLYNHPVIQKSWEAWQAGYKQSQNDNFGRFGNIPTPKIEE